MENYIFAGRVRAGAIDRRVDGDAERLCAAWDSRHAVHRQVLEADHRADDKTMIPAPAIISARAAAFVCSSSVTPRAAAIHLGMNQIQNATKNVAKIAASPRIGPARGPTWSARFRSALPTPRTCTRAPRGARGYTMACGVLNEHWLNSDPLRRLSRWEAPSRFLSICGT